MKKFLIKKFRVKALIIIVLALIGVSSLTLNFIAQAATLIDDVFADGNSANQDLPNNSIQIFKGRTATARTTTPGNAEFDMTTTGTSAEAFWGYFTNSGSPVTLGVGDSLTFAGTFTLTGFVGTSQDIRFGLLDSRATRNTADLTGGQSNAAFGDDTGYAAQFYAAGTGNPFVLYRRDVTNPPTINIFNSFTNAGFTALPGTGATARQPLTSGTPYTFSYTVTRNSTTETQLTVSVTGGTLSNLNYTAIETSASPYNTFDFFTFRIGGNAFTQKWTFNRLKVDFNPAAPVITTQPAPPNQTVSVGSDVQFSVGAQGSQLSYQWLKDGNPILGNATATTPNLQLTNVQNGDTGVYTVRVSNSGGNVTSNPVNLTVTGGPVDPPPMITQPPQDTIVTVGQPATLSVTATGNNLFYQWFKNANILNGETNSTLQFASAQTGDTANYTVTVTNSFGSATSNPARLTVVSAMGVTSFEPVNNSANACTDAPLRLTFNQTPKLGTSGKLRVYRNDGTLVDTIDMSLAAQTKSIGGAAAAFRYFPIIITGNTASVYLHQQLAYNQTYYVTLEPGVLTDVQDAPFVGFSDANTWRFTTKTAAPAAGINLLTVAADGSGNFCTVQGAVDFVPANNAQRVVINVRNGTYTEIVYINSNKPNITVKGESQAGTIVQYANNNNLNGAISGNFRTSFGVDAADFNLENITLYNTTPQGGSQAEALRTNGVRATINQVTLKSFQDTLLTQKSTFVNNSYIEGDVDFMWGNGATYFKNTEIKSLRNGGYYTQIRNNQNTPGNVYVNCRLTRGAAVTNGNYLSRIDPDDFPYSQVVFIDTQMDSHIAPVGWLLNGASLPETPANYPNIKFWEYNSTDLSGNPVDVSQRHPISRQLNASEADFWRVPANVLGGWTPQEKLTAIVTLSNLNQVYDGTPKTPTITTDPSGLTVDVTYNGSSTAPVNAGTYTVVATVNDANYQGSATATLTIAKASATVSLGNLIQNYDGAPKAATVTTNPAGLSVSVTYNGSNTPPTAVGNYNLVATITDPNYTGGASGIFTIKSTVRAFPGAEGAGAYAIGGRGGDIYRVTNLNDAGAGSLRSGIQTATGPRTIVFDVSGTIYLNSRLSINKSFITIAGQTAPGDGITIAGWTTTVDSAQHVIIRYLRFRSGDIRCSSGMEGDSLWVDNSRDVMIDHVSASWSIDESLSVTDSDRVSVQWSFITESLNLSCHPEGRHGYGSLIRYGSGRVSYHHNLYAHHFSRNPRVGDNITFDFVNNVVYDWGNDASYSGAASEGITKINYVGNYLVAGPNTPANRRTRAFNGGSVNTWIYQSGNLHDGNVNGVRDGANTGWAMFVGSYTQQSSPLDLTGNAPENSLVDIFAEDAETAYNRVLQLAGSSVRRDSVDARIVSDVQNETGALINSQNDVGGYPVLNSTPAATDTDGDGIPNDWETMNGLNPNNPNDAAMVNASGYTNLETYLNGGSLIPTAAAVTVAGQVLDAGGRGIAKAQVIVIDSTGNPIARAVTNAFGYFVFDGITAGETYIISVASKRHTFTSPAQAVNVNEDVSGILFVADN
ncbi:MAG TPA: pectinesterase family protein [Pyrinomonadaceae bacterium]